MRSVPRWRPPDSSRFGRIGMPDKKPMTRTPSLHWDLGTAYDLFVSLMALHDPAHFGLRAAWAAGMRSRLPAQERETLEAFQHVPFALVPYPSIYQLPEPKERRALTRAPAR